jgi:hypothetical protein
MIDPHVLHGGASSWFCIAAKGDGFAAGSFRPKPEATEAAAA